MAVDVGMFDYVSGLRGVREQGTTFRFWLQQLTGYLLEVDEEYDHVFLLGHSLGGLIVEEVARQYLQDRFMQRAGHASRLAGLVLIASPRAGSGWAVKPFGAIDPETRILRRLTQRSSEVDEFFSTYVFRHNVGEAPRGQIVLPIYAAIGGSDRLVSAFSASFGVPKRQRKRISAGHSSIVKPDEEDNELVEWLANQVIAARVDVLRQALRLSRYSQSRVSHRSDHAAQPSVVTKFISDSTGLEWEELYNEVRNAATTTSLAVLDVRDAPAASRVDLLLAVHDAAWVLGDAPGTWSTVLRACEERKREPNSSLGISPVGDSFRQAEEVLHSWLATQRLPTGIYVKGARDLSHLREVLARILQLVIGRDSRRRLADGGEGSLVGPDYYSMGGDS